MHAGADHDPLPASIAHHCAHEGCVMPVAQRDFSFQYRRGIFLYRHRFAGQRSFFDTQVHSFGQANVRRDKVAGFEEDNISWDQLIGRNIDPPPIPQGVRFWRGQFFQRRQRLLRPAFLHHPQDGVQNDDGKNRPGVDPFSQDGRDCCGNQQHNHNEIF